MDNKLKRKVLTEMLVAPRLREGLCCALYDVSRSRKFKGLAIKKFFGSYGITKPKDAGDVYWFELNRYGTMRRKKIINEAIKKLSK